MSWWLFHWLRVESWCGDAQLKTPPAQLLCCLLVGDCALSTQFDWVREQERCTCRSCKLSHKPQTFTNHKCDPKTPQTVKGEQKTIQHVRSVRPLPPPALGQQQSGSSRVMSCHVVSRSLLQDWKLQCRLEHGIVAVVVFCGNTRRSWARSELRTWEHGRENTSDPIYFLKYLTPKSNIKNRWNWQMHKRKHKKSSRMSTLQFSESWGLTCQSRQQAWQ